MLSLNRVIHTAQRCTWALFLGLLGTPLSALAGGSPENMLLILDPGNPDSLYIGNYYKNIRNVPASNILYMSPNAASYQAFTAYNQPALFGTLANNRIDDHIDYVVVMPGADFFVNAPNLVSDECFPVSRFSISACYTMVYISSAILANAPATSSTELNRFFNINTAGAFDSSFSYNNGNVSTTSFARRYLIGAMLGYTGHNGNDLASLIAMIDRDAASDGTRAGGTFYFMNNTADPARNVRQPQYASAISAIQALGGAAVQLTGVLPTNAQDCLGVMTGNAITPLSTANMTILPGAFCDHLTSYAAAFDVDLQSKVSDWINFGAGGSWGEVEEPCNYTEKFPNAKIHWLYYSGLSLGESAFRSVSAVPFQGLLYGDPMTRPFAYIPTVSLAGLPGGAVGGTVVLSPSANHPNPDPNAVISNFQLLIDGHQMGFTSVGGGFTLDTSRIADGWHDLRVLGFESSSVKTVGRFVGSLTTNNLGRSASLGGGDGSGDWTTLFPFTVSAVGSGITEIRLVQNGRVVAAAAGASATLSVYGATLGAGPVTVQAEALFADGSQVRSAPQTIIVSNTGGVPSAPPLAFNYTKRIRKSGPAMVELPISFDNANAPPTFNITTNPIKVTVPAGQAAAYRLLTPIGGAAATDSFTFQANSGQGVSNAATVTLVFDDCADVTGDRFVDLTDLGSLLSMFGTCAGNSRYATAADLDGNGCVDLGDLALLLAQYGRVCTWY